MKLDLKKLSADFKLSDDLKGNKSSLLKAATQRLEELKAIGLEPASATCLLTAILTSSVVARILKLLTGRSEASLRQASVFRIVDVQGEWAMCQSLLDAIAEDPSRQRGDQFSAALISCEVLLEKSISLCMFLQLMEPEVVEKLQNATKSLQTVAEINRKLIAVFDSNSLVTESVAAHLGIK